MSFLFRSLAEVGASAATPAPAPPLGAGEAAAVWAAHAGEVAAMSPVPVPFDPGDNDDLAEILAGRPVSHRFDTANGAYATGAVWVDAPISAVWIVIQDAPHDPPSRMVTVRLPAPDGVRRVYMRLDLPYPLADRQWVADVVTNTRLYQATGGAVWQRQWTLADPALAPAPDDKASWVPESRGAWTLVDTGDGTLVLFSVRTVLGGMIPASIAQGWAVSTVKAGMARVADRARAIPTHYVGDHERIVGPDGAVLPPG